MRIRRRQCRPYQSGKSEPGSRYCQYESLRLRLDGGLSEVRLERIMRRRRHPGNQLELVRGLREQQLLRGALVSRTGHRYGKDRAATRLVGYSDDGRVVLSA